MDQQSKSGRIGELFDPKLSVDDLELTAEENIVEPLSTDDVLRIRNATAQRKREAWLTVAGLALLAVIAIGSFSVFVMSENKDKIGLASQVITMVVTALIAFLFSESRTRN